MTKVQIYLAAVAIANDGIVDTNLAFEKRLVDKRIELALPAADDQLFKNNAQQQRANLIALKQQDDQAAAQAAKAKPPITPAAAKIG